MSAKNIRRIPLARPSLGDRERELVQQVLSGVVLALGPFAQALEEELARLAGRRFGIACSSGTAGLHLAVRALGISEGDEVITTPFSFVASANCLLYERARPRFVDIEEETLGLDPALVEAAAGPRTRAILPVHVFGRGCRSTSLRRLPKRADGISSRMRVRHLALAAGIDHSVRSASRPSMRSIPTSR